MGYLIDTSVIVAIERGARLQESLDAHVAQEHAAVSAVTASELLHGVRRADSVTYDLSVATRNVRDFERVEGLAVEVW